MFAKNDEEKRNRLWKTVMTVSTLLIIIIAAFFVIKLFTSNPLEGTWMQEDSGMELSIRGEDSAAIRWTEEFGSEETEILLSCTVDTRMKTLTLEYEEEAVRDAAKSSEGAADVSQIEAALQNVTGTYEYNLVQKELTLTEREYGEQMTFVRKS